MSDSTESKTHIVFPYMECTVTINGNNAEKIKDKIVSNTYTYATSDEIGDSKAEPNKEENGDWN